MDVEEFRRNAHAMVDLIADYHQNIESYPIVSTSKRGDIANNLPDDAPMEGEPFENITRDIQEFVIPGLTHWQHPQFLAFFPLSASFPGILGDFLSSGLPINGMMWATSPACTEIEVKVMDWLAKALDLPKKFLSQNTGGGVIQTSASESVVVSIVAARHKIITQRFGDPFPDRTYGERSKEVDEFSNKLVVYTSDQAHSSVKKGCMITGVNLARFRALPTSFANFFALDPEVLRSQIKTDKENGLIPFYVCSTVGTTASTAIDPINEIGKICQEENVWFHVDGAYSGAASFCPENRWMLKGLDYASSFCFNPTKWGGTPIDCSAMWVHSKAELTNSLSLILTPSYLELKDSPSEVAVNYNDWSISLGRRFRALKIWLVMRSYGINGLRGIIQKDINLAKFLREKIESDSRFEITLPSHFGLLLFQVKNHQNIDDNDVEVTNKLTEQMESHLVRNNFFVHHAFLGGRYYIRLCIGSLKIELKHVELVWETMLKFFGDA